MLCATRWILAFASNSVKSCLPIRS
jgi:hypothetical protein